MNARIGIALVAPVLFIAHPALARDQPIAPQVVFEDLYAEVELQRIFPDSKEFADATPKSPPPDILTLYRAQKPFSPEALKRFIAAHFDLPAEALSRRPRIADSRGVQCHSGTLQAIDFAVCGP